MSPASPAMPWSAWTFPLVSLVFYGLASAFGAGAAFEPTPLGITFAVLLVPVLFGTVFAAVHHAETIAQRTGEPYGTLVLTVAVTIIEVALIASVMLSGDGGGPTLARDTVFAVVMIVCTGLVGACIAIGGLHYREIGFRVTGASAYLTVLLVLATLTLVLPTYTRSVAGPSIRRASSASSASSRSFSTRSSSTYRRSAIANISSQAGPRTRRRRAHRRRGARFSSPSRCSLSRSSASSFWPRNSPRWSAPAPRRSACPKGLSASSSRC